MNVDYAFIAYARIVTVGEHRNFLWLITCRGVIH